MASARVGGFLLLLLAVGLSAWSSRQWSFESDLVEAERVVLTIALLDPAAYTTLESATDEATL